MHPVISIAAKTAMVAATASSPAANHAPLVMTHPVAAEVPAVLTAHTTRTRAIEYRTITVQSGDSLSKLADKHKVPGGWMSIYAANKHKIRNPDLIFPGWKLKLPNQAMHAELTAHYTPRHAKAATRSNNGKVWGVTYGYPNFCGDGDGDGYDMPCSKLHHHNTPSTSSSHRYVGRHSTSTASSGSGSVTPGSSYEACVISRESGGNSQVMNSSGHYGLYQFSKSTWEAYGGSASSFGNASAAEQRRVFLNAMAQGGKSNWSPYDGC